jgi:hypothetical protein
MAKKGNQDVALARRASCQWALWGLSPRVKRPGDTADTTIYLHIISAVRMNAAIVPLVHVLSWHAYRQLVPVLVCAEKDIFN